METLQRVGCLTSYTLLRRPGKDVMPRWQGGSGMELDEARRMGRSLGVPVFWFRRVGLVIESRRELAATEDGGRRIFYR